MNGWIKIHKSIMTHWLWEDPIILKAWLELLICASYEDRKIVFDGKLITLKKGQLITSIRKLAQRWGCSKEKVCKILDLFASDGMLIVDKDNKRTLLTVVNYGLYQSTCDSKTDTESDTESDTVQDAEQDTDSPQIKKYKNKKEIKEEKKDIYTSSIDDIFSYLNQRTGKHFTGRSAAQKKHIIARLKEGYTVEEFKKVIDNKVAAWGHVEKMAVYLRPETLFGTKFEAYLNDVETERQKARREEHELHEKQVAAIRDAADFDVAFLKD